MSPRVRVIILVGLIILVLVTISINANPRNTSFPPAKIFLEAVGTLQRGVTGSIHRIENIWRTYFYLVDLGRENKILRQAIARAKGRIIRMQEAQVANDRLTKLLKFATDNDLPYIGSSVIAWDPAPWFKSMTINRGSRDGVKVGMPVVNDLGVVGQVIQVSLNYSQVMLVIDYNSRVDAFVQRSRARGILAGRSEKTSNLSLSYVRKSDDVMEGDLIVTSGLGGKFPRGLPLGTVEQVRIGAQDIFLNIDIKPTVDFEHLEDVLVVMIEPPPF